MIEYVIFASGGNDSIALVDYAHVKGLTNVAVAYSNTGWASLHGRNASSVFKSMLRAAGFRFMRYLARV